jgi:ATP-binding cassette, subfamily B, bacterial MsbA
MKSLLNLRPYLRPYLHLIVISLVLAIPMAAIRASPLLLAQKLIDDLLTSKDPSKLILYPGLVIGIFGINFIIRFIHYYCLRVVVARVNQNIKNDLYDHVMGLSADYFTSQTNGGLISKVGSDPNVIDQGIAQLNVLIREPFQLVFLFGYTLYLDWKLTLITLAIFPPMAFVFGYSGKALKRYIHRLQEEQSRIFSTLQESFSGFRVIQFFRLEPYMRSRFRGQSERFTNTLLKTAVLEEFSHPAVEFITAFAIAALIYVGGKQVLDGVLTSGQLLSFFGAFAMMQNPIRVLNDMNIKFNTAAGACERVFGLFATQSNIKEVSNPTALPDFKGRVELKNVEFAYPDSPDRKILDDVSLEVKKGEAIALVGASGAGKSSLVSLLPRIFDVTGGEILIDGVNIREYNLKNLRDAISVVSQDVFLFNDTIAENIRCGRLDATDEEIRLAAKHAFADDFIARLPEGYLTVIGDRGQKLSGGERQRLSIARAFLRRSPLLILDEATSSLDSASEKAVQKALDSLMQDRTTFIIAHRLSTIRGVKRIYVLREGKVVESGSHEELMKKEGEYSRFLKLAEVQSS